MVHRVRRAKIRTTRCCLHDCMVRVESIGPMDRIGWMRHTQVPRHVSVVTHSGHLMEDGLAKHVQAVERSGGRDAQVEVSDHESGRERMKKLLGREQGERRDDLRHRGLRAHVSIAVFIRMHIGVHGFFGGGVRVEEDLTIFVAK